MIAFSIKNVLLFGIFAWLLFFAVTQFFKNYSKTQILLFGYLLLPVLRELDGGYIPYPINSNKIYLFYLILSNLIVFHKDNTVLFLKKMAPFIIPILCINCLSYVFVTKSPELFIKSNVYFVALFCISLFAFNARLTIQEIMKVLPGYFYLILVPIFSVCILEILGNRELATFFSGPSFEGWNIMRLGYYRINGIFHWPIILAEYLGCFFVLYFWFGSDNKSFYYMGLIIFAFLLSTIVRTQIVASIAISLLIVIKKYRKQFRIYSFFIIFMSIVLIFFDVGSDLIKTSLHEVFDSGTPRIYYIRQSFSIAVKNFPLGLGIDACGAYQSDILKKQGFKNKYNLKTFKLRTSDTFYSDLLAEFGLVGTSIFIVMLLWFYFYLREELLRLLILFLLASAYNIPHVINKGALGILFWLFVGISLGACPTITFYKKQTPSKIESDSRAGKFFGK
jgi:hypothetical protein